MAAQVNPHALLEVLQDLWAYHGIDPEPKAPIVEKPRILPPVDPATPE